MKRIIFITILILMCSAVSAREYKVYGAQGGIAIDVTLPEHFNPESDKCPMVILMHGIFSSKDFLPMPQLAKSLARQGIASIRFDFGGHWHSEGEMIKMTIARELEDARAIYEYAAIAIGPNKWGANLLVRKMLVGPSAPPMIPIDAAA